MKNSLHFLFRLSRPSLFHFRPILHRPPARQNAVSTMDDRYALWNIYPFNLPQVTEDKYSSALADRPLVETAFWHVAGEEWGENEKASRKRKWRLFFMQL